LYLSSLFLFPFLIISVAIKYLQQMNRCATRFSFFDLTAANACQISHYTTSWFQEIPGIVSIRDIGSGRKRACCWPFLPFSHQDQWLTLLSMTVVMFEWTNSVRPYIHIAAN
jgi:hypothetical protein